MLPKSSSLLQILLLLALVVSLTASPMEESDGEVSLGEERKNKGKTFHAKASTKKSLKKIGTMKTITFLGGIMCNEDTLGRSACSGPKRYDDANDLLRKNYPAIGYLHFIYTCVAKELSKWSKVYSWKKRLCPVKAPFCGVQRFQKDPNNKKPTTTEVVQVLCMGEGELKGKKTIGNKNWHNPNPDMDQKKIDKQLGDRAKYMNQYTVTDHPSVRKSDIEELGLVVKDSVYAGYLKDFKPEKEKVSKGKSKSEESSRGH